MEDANAGADAGVAAGGAGSFQESLGDPAVRECIEEQLGQSFDPESVGRGGDLFGRLGPAELAMLEECGVDVSEGFGTAFGGRRGGGAFGGAVGVRSLPETQECLAELLGEDFTRGFTRRDDDGQPREGLFGPGIGDEFSAAFEECGLDFGGGPFGGGVIQKCLTELLGPDALLSLRNPDSPPSQELLDAFEQCSSPIPLLPGGGIGDGAVPPPIELTATPVPASDLAIEVLVCLSRELDSTELAAVVIATRAGDLTELSDEALAALATCGFES
jgi:hypothetical protein